MRNADKGGNLTNRGGREMENMKAAGAVVPVGPFAHRFDLALSCRRGRLLLLRLF